ncbi:MAG: 1-acyl-sn-glycerol-3-phosphate acyltransferase [Deltaproteobacteria bacterium]|nr:1-acyl-sn-glycerol-3-phosphate acyltransferase [Deltaproteobacteria bacterium]MBN2671239.1 1-acyl-sn-glycerol-3-phosphate acyltransferase [Deltaproteobacteria bacterium]
MTILPHLNPQDPSFPGDASPQPPFGIVDSLRSIGVWTIGAPHLAFWAALVTAVSKVSDTKKIDRAIKFMSRAVPKLAGVDVTVKGLERFDHSKTYVYVVNHVNIFDMFAIYQAIPQYTRSLEHVSHFSWPLIGPFITAAGQIPVDPQDKKLTARGLKRALAMLKNGESLVVLPEGERTLDGTVGTFYPGAFRLAIQANVPVVPMAIHGGRTVSRRGDWRVRPGRMTVSFGNPVPTEGMTIRDSAALAQTCKECIISLLQTENRTL